MKRYVTCYARNFDYQFMDSHEAEANLWLRYHITQYELIYNLSIALIKFAWKNQKPYPYSLGTLSNEYIRKNNVRGGRPALLRQRPQLPDKEIC